MEHPKLLAVLEANIDAYWSELCICDFDQLLAELENSGWIATAQRQSLLLRLGFKKIRDESEEDDSSPLPR